MHRRMHHAFVAGSRTARELLEADVPTLQEFAAELAPECQDTLLNPWRSSGRAAIRRALGH